MDEKGFTVIELVITVAIFLIFLILFGVVSGAILDNRGATEKRALSSARLFLQENNVKVKRLTCAGDSNNDGYGACSVVTAKGEKIFLQCPTGFFDTKLFGASQCKEVFHNLNFSVQ